MENVNNKPWTPATIRENVDNWSLAGDAGLLSYLQNFSDVNNQELSFMSKQIELIFFYFYRI